MFHDVVRGAVTWVVVGSSVVVAVLSTVQRERVDADAMMLMS